MTERHTRAGENRAKYRGRENEPSQRVANERISPADQTDRPVETVVAAPAYDTPIPPRPEPDDLAGAPTEHTKTQWGAFDEPREDAREARQRQEPGDHATTAQKIGEPDIEVGKATRAPADPA